MTNYIRVNAEHSISEGKIDEFKKMAAEMIKKVEANEPNYLSYEWFLSDDESKCYIIGLFKDSEAVMAHLAHIGETMGPFWEIAPTTRIELYGNLSDELKQTVAPFGPKILEHWNGFTR
jgi:quinol monooxygenase YgiN